MGALIPTGQLKPVRFGNALEVEHVLDIRSVGYHQREWIVSRKRNKNLADLSSRWKKSVLATADNEDIVDGYLDEWH